MEEILESLTIDEKLKKFADLKIQQKSIETGIDTLKHFILAHLEEMKVDKLPTTLGTFSKEGKTTWKYSKAVEALQADEKATGVAEKVVSPYVKFTALKPEKEEGAE